MAMYCNCDGIAQIARLFSLSGGTLSQVPAYISALLPLFPSSFVELIKIKIAHLGLVAVIPHGARK